MKILKKITIKTAHGKALTRFPDEAPQGTEKIVLTVYGRADNFEPGSNVLPSGDVSEYNRFKGDFTAFPGNMGEGDQVRSGVMILPEVAGDLLANLLRPEDVNAVNFGFQIGIKKTDTPIGYEYYAIPLIEEAADTDPLAALGKQVQALLSAPKAAEKIADSKETAKASAAKK